MHRVRFEPDYSGGSQKSYSFKSGTMKTKKNVGFCSQGPRGTPTKQRKIYEVWPGNIPQRFKQSPGSSMIEISAKSIPYMQNTVQQAAIPTAQPSEFNDHRGSSGSVAMHPSYPTMPNMYMQSYPQYPPDFWRRSDPVGYSPMQDVTNNQYGYRQDTAMLFQDYPPLFPDRHVTPSSTLTCHQMQQNYQKRTVRVPPKMKGPKPEPSTSRKDDTRKVEPVKLTENSKPPTKNVEKRKPKKIFISTNVRGLHAWEEVKQEVEVIFEIVATLNSQVTESLKMRCKSFLLKDAQGHTVTCEFFETDRKLSRMCRGKMYRCVGNFSSRRGVFHAFCVREADEKDIRIYRKMVAVCNGSLRSFKTIQI